MKQETDKRYTPQEMIEIEPYLKYSENYVKIQNKIAKGKLIYWHKVWAEAKKIHYSHVGFMANDERLRSQECWRIWHEHLKSIAYNCC